MASATAHLRDRRNHWRFHESHGLRHAPWHRVHFVRGCHQFTFAADAATPSFILLFLDLLLPRTSRSDKLSTTSRYAVRVPSASTTVQRLVWASGTSSIRPQRHPC